MLVHKATMGVLDQIWRGEYIRSRSGSPIPLLRSARLEDFPELNAADWWELPDTGPLAKRVRRYYPLLTPVTDEAGELMDVVILRLGKQEEDKAALTAEAARRGYRKRGCVRPKMLFPFLSSSISI